MHNKAICSTIMIILGSISFWVSSIYYGRLLIHRAVRGEAKRLTPDERCTFIGIQTFSWIVWTTGVLLVARTGVKKLKKIESSV